MKNKLLKQELINSGKYYQIQKAKYQAYKDNKYFFINSFDTKLGREHLSYIENNSISEIIKSYYRRQYKQSYQEYKKIREYIDLNYTEYQNYESLRKSRSKQRQQIKDQMQFWVVCGYKIVFNTYTLNNETLKKYNIELDENIDKIQNLLTRILSKYTDDYIGNIDYGKKHDRLHFHVLEAYKPDTNHYFYEELLNTNYHNELDYTDPFTKRHENINELQEYKTKQNYNDKSIKIITTSNTAWNSKYGFTYPELIEYNKQSYNRLPSYLAKLCNHSIKVKKKRLFKKKISKVNEDGSYTDGSEYKNYKYLKDHFKAKKDLSSKQLYYANLIKNNDKKEEFQEQQYEMIKILEYL